MNLVNLLDSRILGFSAITLQNILAQNDERYRLTTERDSTRQKLVVIHDEEMFMPNATVYNGEVGALQCVNKMYGLVDGTEIKETSNCFEVQKKLLGKSIGHEACIACHLRATEKVIEEDICLKRLITKKRKRGNKKITFDVFS
ncbi:hypothetical protein [Kurthia sp. Dielmo]|uniref:hypothetical protein n=1 Tax=Kurthia sp. Dielmo TaxID=1033738 RepID=UPI001122B9CB|nr:hypothetical protein [Kurthia sp. Dielmo]